MLSVDDVEALVSRGESETVEFKKSTGARKEAVRTLTAMLNGDGGTVLFGVTDDGTIVGQDVTAKTMEDCDRDRGIPDCVDQSADRPGLDTT